MKNTPPQMTLAVLGGTGKEGKGLVYRWAKAGFRVLIGSRSQEKGWATANELIELIGSGTAIEGATSLAAAQQAEIVALAVPYTAHRETLELIKGVMKGKLLIDVTVPLVPPKVYKVEMPMAGSAAQEAHEILGVGVEVTTAFQNISCDHLFQDGPVECDVLVTGTSLEARSKTLKLVAAAGFSGWDAGPIENSVVIEGMTSVLIGINMRYGSKSSGIRIVGVQAPAQES